MEYVQQLGGKWHQHRCLFQAQVFGKGCHLKEVLFLFDVVLITWNKSHQRVGVQRHDRRESDPYNIGSRFY